MGARSQAALVVHVDGVAALEGALALAERVGPVTLAMPADAAVAAARARPALQARVRAGFAAGRLGVVGTTAHGCEPELLGEDELEDELRLDEETLPLALGALPPRRRGCDGLTGAARLERAGVDFVLIDGGAPCRVGDRLIALPVVREAATADGLAAAERAAREALGDGATLVTADALAETLTPPWLPRRTIEVPRPPAALRALAALTGWCRDAYGVRRVPGVPAAALVDEGWRLERFPARARLPFVRRRGLCAERRAFVAGYELCDVLAIEARVPGLSAHATTPLQPGVLATVTALAAAHGAGEPMARAAAAYAELRAFRFLGALRWRALLSSLRDAFALLSSRRRVDWSTPPPAEEEPAPARLHVAPMAPAN